MHADITEIKDTLVKLSPSQRLQYLRKHVIGQNQSQFCKDGLIRPGTLKAIESDSLAISENISKRLIHKLSLEGIICHNDIFQDDNEVNIEINHSKKTIIGDSTVYLEMIRKKINSLVPIKIQEDTFAPHIPKNSILLVSELKEQQIHTLKNQLCLVIGSGSPSVYYLNYEDEIILATYNDDTKELPTDILSFCDIYKVELIYLGNN